MLCACVGVANAAGAEVDAAAAPVHISGGCVRAVPGMSKVTTGKGDVGYE